MDICLDTNGYGRLLHGSREVRFCLEGADRVLVPTIVLGELHAGFQVGTRPTENVGRLQAFLASPQVEVADVTESVADRYGRIFHDLKRQGTPLPTNDIWIAAVTLESGARLLSYDGHFERVPGLIVVRP